MKATNFNIELTYQLNSTLFNTSNDVRDVAERVEQHIMRVLESDKVITALKANDEDYITTIVSTSTSLVTINLDVTFDRVVTRDDIGYFIDKYLTCIAVTDHEYCWEEVFENSNITNSAVTLIGRVVRLVDKDTI